MKTSLLLSILASSWLTAGSLLVTQAKVEAHTEVFGDSTINPVTTHLKSHLSMGKNIESMRGSIDISMLKLKSDNSKRDEHMVESIESAKYPFATYTFKEVKKSSTGYSVHGILDFHGVKKPLTIEANIVKTKSGLHFNGTSGFLMSSYNVTPPTMFFLTVRDQVDLKIDVMFKNR